MERKNKGKKKIKKDECVCCSEEEQTCEPCDCDESDKRE
jgi:hypothetical protein